MPILAIGFTSGKLTHEEKTIGYYHHEPELTPASPNAHSQKQQSATHRPRCRRCAPHLDIFHDAANQGLGHLASETSAISVPHHKIPTQSDKCLSSQRNEPTYSPSKTLLGASTTPANHNRDKLSETKPANCYLVPCCTPASIRRRPGRQYPEQPEQRHVRVTSICSYKTAAVSHCMFLAHPPHPNLEPF